MLGFSHQSLTHFLFWATQKKWFLISLLAGTILLLLPTPSGLTIEGYRIIIIVITALSMIITEPIPLPGIALYIIVAEVVLGIGTPEEISKSFMNDAVFFIMGSLMLAVTIVQQGWDKRIALGIIRLTGHKTKNIIFGFTAISAILSSFIGGHTVAALMLPIVMALIKYTSKDREKVQGLSAVLLFAIAYGALIGSIGTPSGGGRNVIIMSYLQEYNVSISYLRWMIMCYPFVLIMIPIVSWILMKSFTPEFVHLDTGVRKLVVQVAKAPKLTGRDTVAAFIFFLVFLGWVLEQHLSTCSILKDNYRSATSWIMLGCTT